MDRLGTSIEVLGELAVAHVRALLARRAPSRSELVPRVRLLARVLSPRLLVQGATAGAADESPAKAAQGAHSGGGGGGGMHIPMGGGGGGLGDTASDGGSSVEAHRDARSDGPPWQGCARRSPRPPPPPIWICIPAPPPPPPLLPRW